MSSSCRFCPASLPSPPASNTQSDFPLGLHLRTVAGRARPLASPQRSILNQVSLGQELAVLKLLCMFTGVEKWVDILQIIVICMFLPVKKEV